MRKIGLIGGMSWVSTGMYYDFINRYVQRRSEAFVSPPIVMESLNFADLHGLLAEEDWARAGEALAASAKRLEQAGATAILICANSMHKVYDTVAASVSVPVLHIADCVGEAMKAAGATNAALIGTRNVMTESFYRQRLIAHGVDLAAPDMKNVDIVDRIIYEELMVGKKIRDSERELRTIITKKQQDGLEAIVLACTELDMIVDVDANVLPIFDSTRIHCQAAADWILGE
ncbi:MAG: amino acid racemase [Marinomonas sp.]